jgi:hypothetical protein
MPPPKITVPVPDSIIPVSQPKGKDTGKKKKRRKARRRNAVPPSANGVSIPVMKVWRVG